MIKAYFIILAGGNGQRLWPLSTPTRPKPLIPFVDNTSLFEQTLQRLKNLGADKNHLVVVTNKDQQDAIKSALKNRGSVMVEPVGRNTAPALLLACMQLAEKNPDAVMVMLPSDHFIPEPEKFSAQLAAAISCTAWMDYIAVLGIRPTSPATGYGYIQYSPEPMVPGWSCFGVSKFHEKPDLQTAQAYTAANDFLWNSGIVIARAKILLQEYQQLAPELFTAMHSYLKGETDYATLQSISVDHAILEKSNKVVVFPAFFTWHDVGNLTTFLSLKAQFEKQSTPQIINVDAHSNIACSPKKTIAFVGVSNLCIVETEEELLVVAQDQVESVRDVMSSIKQSSMQPPKETITAASVALEQPLLQPELAQEAAPEVVVTKPERTSRQRKAVDASVAEAIVDQQNVA